MKMSLFGFLGSRVLNAALWKFSAIGFGLLVVVFIGVRIMLAIRRRKL